MKLSIVCVAVLLASCSIVESDPNIVGSKFVRVCSGGSMVILELPKTKELVISRSLKPYTEDQIYRVSNTVNIDAVCSSRPFAR